MSYLRGYTGNRMSGLARAALAIILLAALVARLVYLYNTEPLKLSHDETGYHQMTEQFLDKGFLGYYADKPTAFVTPGYPLFLAAIYSVVKALWGAAADPLPAVYLIQVLLSTGTVYLAFAVGRSTGRLSTGFVAAVLVAAYPPMFMANKRILTEVLYSFLLLWYVYSVQLMLKRRILRYHLLNGALLALTVLIRPTGAPLLVVPYIIEFWHRRDPVVIKGLFVAGVAFSLVMMPWWVRNYVVLDQVVLFATQSGNPLLRGTDPYDPYDKIGPSIIEGVPEQEMSKVALKRIKNGLKTEPWLWIKWFTAGKFSFLWAKPWGMYSWGAKTMHLGVFVLLGWTGVIYGFIRRELRWPAVVPVLFTLLQLLFIPIARYMFPLTPLMAVMAAAVMTAGLSRFAGRPQTFYTET
ncbi:glycosyltransferase family 39 protein [bacterium]|nr:MAG: glycosyltransferase family 39 protein [bacterium]